ncbi:hypothetical protein TH61_15860 [Rufibacter sp. DG15C]|nr:hypothetical protein TH61_15860 [Rufibacter sp. DG15C]
MQVILRSSKPRSVFGLYFWKQAKNAFILPLKSMVLVGFIVIPGKADLGIYFKLPFPQVFMKYYIA